MKTIKNKNEIPEINIILLSKPSSLILRAASKTSGPKGGSSFLIILLICIVARHPDVIMANTIDNILIIFMRITDK